MEFTPQQLAGAGAYNPATRIGNWNLDVCLLKEKEAEYERSRRRGTRTLDMLNKVRKAGCVPTALSYLSDGVLTYGSKVSIRHHKFADYVVASNISEEAVASLPGSKEYQATASRTFQGQSTVRTTFIVTSGSGKAAGESVCYGDEVVFETEPALRVNAASGLCQFPFYLYSTPKGLNGSSIASGEQEVTIGKLLNAKNNAYIRWKIRPNGRTLNPLEETRVVASDCVQIVHCATGKALSSNTKFPVLNAFSNSKESELELFCANDLGKGNVSLMRAEFEGRKTSKYRVPVGATNWWTFECAENEAAAQDDRDIRFISPQTVSKLVRELIHSSVDGPQGLLEALTKADQANDGVLDMIEFKWVLIDYGIDVSDDEFECLLGILVDRATGGVSIETFRAQFLVA